MPVIRNLPAKEGRWKSLGFNPWGKKIPWRKKWQPTPVFLPGESHEQSSLVGVQSIGLQRVGHDWSDLAQTHACQVLLPLGRKTDLGEPSQMCTALPLEAKMAFWKINGAFGSLCLNKGDGKKLFWRGFQRRGLQLQDGPCIHFFLNPCFLFSHSLSSSCFSCFLLSFLLRCLAAPKWFLPFLSCALSSDLLLVHTYQERGVGGHFVWWRDMGFGI